ncbi:unnamed protein product, partial [Polarella glacialis]
MFMGNCVMAAYLLVLLIVPPLLVVAEKRALKRVRSRVVDISSGDRDGLQTYPDGSKSKHKVEKEPAINAFLFTLTGWIVSCPCMILGVTFLFFIMSAVGVVRGAALAEGVPEIFPKDHNQVAGKALADKFGTVPDLYKEPPVSGSVCRADSTASSSQDCIMHWCQ